MIENMQTFQRLDNKKEREQSLDDLCKYLSRRLCRNAVFLYDKNISFQQVIKKYISDALIKNIDSIDDLKKQHFHNVILMEVLENYKQKFASEILKKSWQLLKEKGRLTVIAANEDIYNHKYQIRHINQNELKKKLRTFGYPKMMIEQPFKWLAMYVKKSPVKEENKTVVKRMNTIAKLCKRKVIEFGCGRGLLAKKVNDLGLGVTGVDICGKKIEEAKNSFPNIEFIHANVLELNFSSNSFDTVLLPEILEHITEDAGDKLLDIAWDILKPGGRLIVSVPNNQCIPSLNHIRLFTKDSLNNLLKSFGKPNIVVEQPYKWLLMYVDKPLSYSN